MDKDLEQTGKVSRRDFTALSVAAGLSVTAGATPAAALAVTESDVTIKTPDGTCDAAFIRPATGKHPGVLIWTDVFGLRPTFRDMAKRLAGEGYAVLVPNPFYRTQKAPVMEDASKLDFNDAGYPRQDAELDRPDQRGRRHRARRRRLCRLPGCAKGSGYGKEDRHPGLLHGRPAGVQDRGDDVQSGRRGRHIPWRRPGHRQAGQPASADPQDSRRTCISPSPPATTPASPTPRTS